MSWLKLALAALDLAIRFARWVEREKLVTETRAEVLRDAMEKIDAQVEEAGEIRARTRAELDVLDGAGLRQHPDARFRD